MVPSTIGSRRRVCGGGRILRLGLLAGLACLGSHVGSAQELKTNPAAPRTPDAVSGRSLAEKLCKSCHMTGTGDTGTAVAGVPSFASLANRPNQSTEALTRWLIEPHPPMPNLQLAKPEIDDLAAYILTLRK